MQHQRMHPLIARICTRYVGPFQSTFDCGGQRDGRVEMRTRYAAQRQDDGHQRCPCGDGICQKSNGNVTAAQALSHDARANDGGEQKSGTQSFGSELARTRHEQQSGEQQPCGFVARMNALMNFPSMSEAMASTSML